MRVFNTGMVLKPLLLCLLFALLTLVDSVARDFCEYPPRTQSCAVPTFGLVEMSSGAGWSALVAGGTGAIGKYLVAELLASSNFASVTVIGRREIAFPTEKQPSEEQIAKLRYHKISDLAELPSVDPSHLTPSKYDVAFCALGTTRKDAGSADAFRNIDYDGVINFGNLAKQVEVEHLQLVSSVGANKNSFLLYPKTKGESEEYYKTLGIRQLTIFRPPLLDRGDAARLVEKIAKFVLPSTKVGDVAKAMVRQAESVLQSNEQGVKTLSTKDIKALCQES